MASTFGKRVVPKPVPVHLARSQLTRTQRALGRRLLKALIPLANAAGSDERLVGELVYALTETAVLGAYPPAKRRTAPDLVNARKNVWQLLSRRGKDSLPFARMRY